MLLILNRYHKEEKIILKESKESVERKHFSIHFYGFRMLSNRHFQRKKESPFLPLGKYTQDMLLYRSRQYLYA